MLINQGIHNQPEEEWDGVVNKAAPGWGYCAHGETVFPTWHRVYMGMFEVQGDHTPEHVNVWLHLLILI